jgi:hypothetical protein
VNIDTKTIEGWGALREFGFNALTGEACNLGIRMLVDLTPKARNILCELWGLNFDNTGFREAWNSGSKFSALIPHSTRPDIAAICLFHAGWTVIALMGDGDVVGVKGDSESIDRWIEMTRDMRPGYFNRVLFDRRNRGEQPTKGIDNVHQISGNSQQDKPAAEPEPEPPTSAAEVLVKMDGEPSHTGMVLVGGKRLTEDDLAWMVENGAFKADGSLNIEDHEPTPVCLQNEDGEMFEAARVVEKVKGRVALGMPAAFPAGREPLYLCPIGQVQLWASFNVGDVVEIHPTLWARLIAKGETIADTVPPVALFDCVPCQKPRTGPVIQVKAEDSLIATDVPAVAGGAPEEPQEPKEYPLISFGDRPKRHLTDADIDAFYAQYHGDFTVIEKENAVWEAPDGAKFDANEVGRAMVRRAATSTD